MDLDSLSVDKYIATKPLNIQPILERVRSIIINAAPDAVESISYGMPAYKLNGKPLVYFAGQTKHLGFYATPSGHNKFQKELEGYKHGKGSVQFPYKSEIPYNLIKDIVIFRVTELS